MFCKKPILMTACLGVQIGKLVAPLQLSVLSGGSIYLMLVALLQIKTVWSCGIIWKASSFLVGWEWRFYCEHVKKKKSNKTTTSSMEGNLSELRFHNFLEGSWCCVYQEGAFVCFTIFFYTCLNVQLLLSSCTSIIWHCRIRNSWKQVCVHFW